MIWRRSSITILSPRNPPEINRLNWRYAARVVFDLKFGLSDFIFMAVSRRILLPRGIFRATAFVRYSTDTRQNFHYSIDVRDKEIDNDFTKEVLREAARLREESRKLRFRIRHLRN